MLTLDEVGAIEWWLNVGSRLLRERTERDCTDERLEELLSRFDSALAKAPTFSGIVYRGTAASPLRSRVIAERRARIAVIGGPVAVSL